MESSPNQPHVELSPIIKARSEALIRLTESATLHGRLNTFFDSLRPKNEASADTQNALRGKQWEITRENFLDLLTSYHDGLQSLLTRLEEGGPHTQPQKGTVEEQKGQEVARGLPPFFIRHTRDLLTVLNLLKQTLENTSYESLGKGSEAEKNIKNQIYNVAGKIDLIVEQTPGYWAQASEEQRRVVETILTSLEELWGVYTTA